MTAGGKGSQDDGNENRIRQYARKVWYVNHCPGKIPPEGKDAKVGDHKQKDFSKQDSQYYEDCFPDAGPPVVIVDLWEEVSGCQGAGEEQRPDEQRFKEAVIKTAEYNRHQKNGDYPVGYDQKPFHFQHKYSKRTGVLPIKKATLGF